MKIIGTGKEINELSKTLDMSGRCPNNLGLVGYRETNPKKCGRGWCFDCWTEAIEGISMPEEEYKKSLRTRN